MILSFLVSLDVRSLYTNVPYKERIETVKQKLKNSKPTIRIKVILNFLKSILTLNNFVFNGINYLQKKGCAMGTKGAPSYANIFMDWFIFPLLIKVSNFNLRFIDDIFLIWNGNKIEFDNFLKEINECHPSIIKINFLDTTLFKVDNKLRSKVYVKPTDRQSY